MTRRMTRWLKNNAALPGLIGNGNDAKAEENFRIALHNSRIPGDRTEALVALGTVTGMNTELSRSASWLNAVAQVDPNNSKCRY
ncbi:MAG: hypothetical protein ACLQHK_04880 [Gallionellaceae bacterium]